MVGEELDLFEGCPVKNNEKFDNVFAELCDKMDARERFYLVLEKTVERTGKVPEQYRKDWEVWTGIERRRPWRTQPLVVARIKNAARIMARAK